MNDPIKIFSDIRHAYLKYISSGLPFFRKEYGQERDKLMEETGTICQPPIIELVTKYHEKASLKDFCTSENVSQELNDFVNTGLFTNSGHQERKLYDHQYSALKEAFINRKHIVVTTGTGSGKTECFLLPIIADLVKESKKWEESRPRAMRAMILYPLNALAEDQMIRLRKALNSRKTDGTGALDWLDKFRNGHRFYFGRYTGATPVSGTKEKSKSRLAEEKRLLTKDWIAAKNSHDGDLLYHIPCMEQDSAEMWDRFSMQDNAPDILITNYSMLNVMLMRENEADIFADTKKWLREDRTNVFHLVIDELHTTIIDLIVNKGVYNFLFGSRSEFDDLCYEVVCELKKEYPHIRRIYVRAEYPYIDDDYKAYLLERYEDTYYPKHIENSGKSAYVERNLEMINNSEYCFLYYDENYIPPRTRKSHSDLTDYQPKSGTKIAYEYAVKKCQQVINVFQAV